MPDNFDDNSLDNMSIEDINELFEDVIDMQDEYKFLALIKGSCLKGPAAFEDRARLC